MDENFDSILPSEEEKRAEETTGNREVTEGADALSATVAKSVAESSGADKKSGSSEKKKKATIFPNKQGEFLWVSLVASSF